MSTDLSLQIVVGAKDAASNVVGGIASNIVGSLGNVNPALGAVAGGMLAIVGGAIAVGVASTQMAAQYQQTMNMVQALTGSSTQQMAQYDAGVKQLAVDAGVAPNELAKGLYNVLSASYKGATAMQVLTLATEDSKIGMTSATVTTDALTNILRSFGVQTKDITATNGEMLTTVTLGKATFEQYATTIVKSASAATQFHVSMETMNAAWATMTSSGIRAAQASTDFQQSLKVMYGNIGAVTKSLNKAGIAFDQNKFNAMSYGDKVVYLNNALEQAAAKHVKITGVTIQAAQAVNTIAKHIKDYDSNLATLSDKQAMAQKTQQAWAITQGGFNQTLDRAKAALNVLFITIGQQLLPVLTQLAAQVVPLIQQFTQWLTKSGALQAMGHGLAAALGFVISAISHLVSIGATVINFFRQNEIAMAALKATLIVLAVAIGVGMTIALYNMAVAAWAAMVPFLPLIAVILAAIVVVTLIILAVQHWGQIAHWLQGIWADVAGFFIGIWQNIQHGFQIAVAFLVSVARAYFTLWFNIVTFPIRAIAALFIWLYNHNTYFKMLVDFIVNIFKVGLAWLINAWHVCVAAVIAVWNWLGNEGKALMSLLQGVFHEGIQWIVDQWNGFIDSVRAIWQTISTFFSSVWTNYIQPPLQSLWNSIVNFVSGWPTQAVQWGINLIQGFINGIGSMLGAVGNAVGKVAGTVAKFLGFHSPAEEGPGQHLLEWPRNMVRSYADEMVGQTPYLKNAVAMTIAPLVMMSHAIPLTSSSTPLVSNSGGTTHNYNISVNAPARTQDEADEIAQTVAEKLGNMLQGQSTLVGGLR